MFGKYVVEHVFLHRHKEIIFYGELTRTKNALKKNHTGILCSFFL